MADEKIERLDLTEVAAGKPRADEGPKVKEPDQTAKGEQEQEPEAPSVSLKDAPLRKN
jgi:hypothetical protein